MANKIYNYKTLIATYINANSQKHIHEDFQNYYKQLLAKLQELFGVELSEQGSKVGMLWYVFQDAVIDYIGPYGKGSWLEGGPTWILEGSPRFKEDKLAQKIVASWKGLHQRHHETNRMRLELLYDFFEFVYGKTELTFTSEDLLAAGFDDSKEPKLEDYYGDL